MYAVKENMAKVNDQAFPVFTRKVVMENGVLQVTAGTTGFMGGDREAGGRAYLSIEGCPGVDMHADLVKDDGNVTGFELAFCGDEELDALVTALHFAETALIEQTLKEND